MASLDTRIRLAKQYEKRRAEAEFDVEGWVAMLGKETFGTRFVPMSLAQANALVVDYQHRFTDRPAASPEQLAEIEELTKAVAGAMHSDAGTNSSKRWFVRLSTRSPKDAAVLDEDLFKSKLREHFAGVLAQGQAGPADEGAKGEEEDAITNARLRAYFTAQKDMSVATAPEAMAMLQASERVFSDLLVATYSDELYREHPLQIVLRDWEPRLDPEMEYRGFVHGGELTALCQYNHYVHLPALVATADDVCARLRAYWAERVRPLVQLDAYVVDFAVLIDGTVVVVELNPFAETTGGALFDWKRDGRQLRNGPFEFRVHLHPVPGLKDLADYAIERATRTPGAFRLGDPDDKKQGAEEQGYCAVM